MKTKNLDGEISFWKLTGHIVNDSNDRAARSKLHLETRRMLKINFPTLIILEEVPIHLHKNEISYLDFYLPLKKLAIEVNGEQHFKFIPFFHGTTMSFIKSKKKDNDKKEWCNINGIKLIEFNFNESIDEWKNKLI